MTRRLERRGAFTAAMMALLLLAAAAAAIFEWVFR